jgi:hypothetical protein
MNIDYLFLSICLNVFFRYITEDDSKKTILIKKNVL